MSHVPLGMVAESNHMTKAPRPDTNPSCSSHQDPLTTRFKETHFSIVFKCLYYDEDKCVKKEEREKKLLRNVLHVFRNYVAQWLCQSQQRICVRHQSSIPG